MSLVRGGTYLFLGHQTYWMRVAKSVKRAGSGTG